jgi:DNA-directed RNA polymerase subunit F
MILNLKRISYLLSAIIMGGMLTLSSCKEKQDEEEVEPIDSNKTNIVNINGTLFSIPSPIQTAMLLKQVGAPYNKAMLNGPGKIAGYSTEAKRALNLGAYGADLGYIILYQQTQEAIGYLSAVKKLSEDVGISGAFDAKLIERFKTNMSNKDSLLVFTSEAFRSSDAYLKNNDRGKVSSLIIAGGWVESLFFTSEMFSGKVADNQKLLERIGEQKTTLDNLIKLLTPYYQEEGLTEFVDGLLDLASEFDKIEVNYVYVKPTTDEANKITTINSTTEVKVSPELMKTIQEKVKNIRGLIIN